MNTRIDHNNYEAFLLDRMEGNLTSEQERELDAFLLIHPELAPDDALLPNFTKVNAQLSGEEKQALMRALPPVGMPGEAPLDDLLIAKLEGDLSPKQYTALKAYLQVHPEHEQADRIYALTKLLPAAMAFVERELLVRTLPPSGLPMRYSIDDFLVARMEGDLSAEQGSALAALIAKDAEVAHAWALIQRTRVDASPLIFQQKELLKRSPKVIPIGRPVWTRLAVAASIALLLGWSVWNWRTSQVEGQAIAELPRTSTPGIDAEKERTDPKEQIKEASSTQDRDTNVAQIAVQPAVAIERPDVPAVRSGKQGPVHEPSHTEREDALPLAERRLVQFGQNGDRPDPIHVVVPDVPVSQGEEVAEVERTPTNKGITLPELLAGQVRERVLDLPGPDVRPFTSDDAVAAIDRGLKLVAGEKAGLDVAAKTETGNRGFSLRLGHNFSISR